MTRGGAPRRAPRIHRRDPDRNLKIVPAFQTRRQCRLRLRPRGYNNSEQNYCIRRVSLKFRWVSVSVCRPTNRVPRRAHSTVITPIGPFGFLRTTPGITKNVQAEAGRKERKRRQVPTATLDPSQSSPWFIYCRIYDPLYDGTAWFIPYSRSTISREFLTGYGSHQVLLII